MTPAALPLRLIQNGGGSHGQNDHSDAVSDRVRKGSAILVVLGLRYIVFSSRIALEALNELSKHF